MTNTTQTAAQLRANLAQAISNEQIATADVLGYLAEYEARELHLRDGFSSIYTFLTQHHGYSEGAAARRCTVVRFSRKNPAVLSMIANGTLSLSVADLIARAVNRGDLRGAINDEGTSPILDACSRKSKSEAEQILAAMGAAPLAAVRRESVRAVSVRPPVRLAAKPSEQSLSPLDRDAGVFNDDGPPEINVPVNGSANRPTDVSPGDVQVRQEFRISLNMSAVAMDQLRRAQELLGTPDLATTIEKLATFHNHRKDPLQKAERSPVQVYPSLCKARRHSRRWCAMLLCRFR